MVNAIATAPVKTEEEKKLHTLRDLLERSKNSIANALPKHLTPERMIRVALTCYNRTPALRECTQLSIVGCVVQASELGLELSGPLGQAYMVPRWNSKIGSKEAIFQVGYRGFIDLAFRTGKVDGIPMRVVYTNDYFRMKLGTAHCIEHEPNEAGPPPIQDASLPYPDNVRGVYCIVMVRGSERPDFEYMTTAQIEAHRRKFSPDSYKGFSPWGPNWEAMAMKTPCRRVCKRVPLSIEFQQAIAYDEQAEFDHDQLMHGRQIIEGLPGPGAVVPAGRMSLKDTPGEEHQETNGNGQHTESQTGEQASTGTPTLAGRAPEAKKTPRAKKGEPNVEPHKVNGAQLARIAELNTQVQQIDYDAALLRTGKKLADLTHDEAEALEAELRKLASEAGTGEPPMDQ